MAKDAAFISARPGIQYVNANGGWPEGDESFTGPGRPEDALITYYQKRRHIFGDLKMEILDPSGKVVDTVSSSKHRGLNRARWSMRLKPPLFPPAAGAIFGVSQGPRVLPGTYTVKMTKGDQVYTTQLNVVLDPRAKYNVQERKAQFDLTVKLYNLLGRMTYAVDSIVGVRDSANMQAAKLQQGDALRNNLQKLSNDVDTLRGKIVATKEGGAITGEERIREFLGQLYGAVNQFDGRPTDSQAARTEALGRELEDVIQEFEALTKQQLPTINAALQQKNLPPIRVLTQQEWDKQHQEESGGQVAATTMREID